MKGSILAAILFLAAHIPIFADETHDQSAFRLAADAFAIPYLIETEENMAGVSLNGSVFFGWGSKAFVIGGEVWEHYLSLNAGSDPLHYNGAWNILRATATLRLAPLDWLSFKLGLGGAWFRSAFSSDEVGTISREGAGISAIAEVSCTLIPSLLTLSLRNRFDLVFLADGAAPFYYGGLNASFYPGADWIALYVEAGLQTFIQQGSPREHDEVMFVLSAGVKIDIAFSAAPVNAVEKQLQELKTGGTGKTVSFETIIFYPDSPVLKPESFPVMDQIALILKERKTITVEIRGHTNDLGDAKDEFDLSLKRAETVREYLIRKGIALARMKCAGLGSEFSKNLAITEANRKVEFRIMSE
ncbi:MAG: OmpA family protein [Spirochaetaceae bacterium]|nr:MAG: OmpA family protein [Spirochaetaceae bacterium]